MAVIKPFKGIRPPKALVEQVASRPYDVLNSEEARAEAEEKSFRAQARLQGIEAERERLLAGAKKEAQEAAKAANLGMYGYLVNVNTNGNYIQIYYLNNSYNNEIKKLRKKIESSAVNNVSEVRAAMRGKFNEEESKLNTEVIRKKAEKNL